MDDITNREIIIALISVVGVICTAVFSNWDKIFSNNKQKKITPFTGYKATGNFETELRYFYEVSGSRNMLETAVKNALELQKSQLIKLNPDEESEINSIFTTIEREVRFEDVIKKFMPTYIKHYSVEEIQELNKFYSTEAMQNMVNKNPYIMADAQPLQLEYMHELQERIEKMLSIPIIEPEGKTIEEE